MTPISKPQGVFQGSNFMTPNPLAYFAGTLDGRRVYIELSDGTGIFTSKRYGVTFRYADGSKLDADFNPSDCFETRKEANQVIREYAD